MFNKQTTPVVITLFILASLFSFYVWDDYVDPPFIGNAHYHFLIFRLIPLLIGVLYLIMTFVAIKRYKTNRTIKEHTHTQLARYGKLKMIGGYLFLPFLMYCVVWVSVAVPIKLYTYYWSPVAVTNYSYVLDSVESCHRDWGPYCSRLNMLDVQTQRITTIHWYEDKNKMLNLSRQKITLVGQQSYFGLVVNQIQW